MRQDLTAYSSRRRRALAQAVTAAKVDALLVSRATVVTYLCGFDGEDSFLLLGRGLVCVITDGRFAQQVRRQCGRIQVHVRDGPMAQAVAKVVAQACIRRLGVQAADMTVAMRDALAAAAGKAIAVKPVADVVLQMRAVKDAREVAGVVRAVRIAERAFRELVAGGAKALIGRTERDVAAELDWRMRRGGADFPAFDTVVATGPNSALPHHRPGRDKVRAGRGVLIDWGAWAGGFASDLTRVVFPARIPPTLRGVYEVVCRARKAGLAELAGGVRAAEADRAARAVIDSAGYGECFVHGLGHGLGRGRGNRQVHELPHLSRWSTETLRAGMVVTVEPGIYLPGVGGIRIEDDVLITAGGYRKLSTLPVAAAAMVLR
ncbi:MAG: Xaa-Pro peptidase family protein [Phycisphaerae bacterium]|nr:Xaa-Pro peptidase family protein [Phycisphaerae bacterium]